MIFGHPPPAPRPLRPQLQQRLSYLDDLLRGGLDDYFHSHEGYDARQAYRELIQAYVTQAESLLPTLPHEADTGLQLVLMDIPVCVVEEETGTAEWFTVVGPQEADPGAGLISFLSPLGSALLLKRVGESVMLDAPGGQYLYRIAVIGTQIPT